ncbi:MAG: RNA-binding S4 domain-containing protein [Arcanobacterium sp.]
MEEFAVRLPIQLGQFVKLTALAETGGHARELIQDGVIYVNGQVNTRRSAKLNDGDVVELRIPGGPRAKIRVISE